MATATGVYHTDYRRDLALRHTRAEHVRLVLLAAVVVAAPFYLEDYWLEVVNTAGIAVVAAVGLNILTGYTGLISLGTGAFLGVGGYTAANVIARADLPTPLGWLAAVVVAAALGAFFGLPALRLKGLYLAIATLAAQYILLYLFRNADAITGGVDSVVVAKPEVAGYKLNSDFVWYWIIVAVAALVVIGAVNLFRTGLGRAFIAIRDQDIAAEVIGVNVGRYKILVFALSVGLAGLSGAMTASYRGVVSWERYTLEESILFVAMIIVGGLGSVSGAVYGALFIVWLPAYIQRVGPQLENLGLDVLYRELPAVQVAAFGLVIVLFLLFEPRGIARLWQRIKDYFRLWPFRY
ncbi:MAG: branched-chain amino acid ABC transporter permease [Actinomycetota bacterium]|nr:branched-chain amino acid ABC transporter permease [Actinomycetota bacterium]